MMSTLYTEEEEERKKKKKKKKKNQNDIVWVPYFKVLLVSEDKQFAFPYINLKRE
jgi:hypothetical protein